MKMNVKITFDSLKNTGLQQEEFHENLSWDEYVSELSRLSKEDNKLKELICRKKTEEMIDEVTLETIITSNFMTAKNAIDQMTIAKRIALLEEAHEYRDYLYQSASRYGMEGIPKEEQLSAAHFRSILGRIKHLEILINWLYGIM